GEGDDNEGRHRAAWGPAAAEGDFGSPARLRGPRPLALCGGRPQALPGGRYAPGICALTWAPCPGRQSTSRYPPRARMRSMAPRFRCCRCPVLGMFEHVRQPAGSLRRGTAVTRQGIRTGRGRARHPAQQPGAEPVSAEIGGEHATFDLFVVLPPPPLYTCI